MKKNLKQVRKYIGPCEAEGDLQDSRKRSLPIFSQAFGPYWMLSSIGDRIGLWSELEECFGKELGEQMKILVRYRGRDDVESDFRMLKTDLQGGVKCLQTDLSADGMIFIQFISLILRCELFRTLKECKLYKRCWIPDVFNELSKLKVTKIGDKWLLNEVSRKQRTIFESLAIEVPTTDSLQSLVIKNYAKLGFNL